MSTDRRPDAENWPSAWVPRGQAARPPKVTEITAAIGLGEWTTEARCHGQWDLFDAPDHGATELQRAEQLTAARAICARCPVARECDTFATTATPAVSGIWAGTRRYPTSQKRNPAA